MIHKIKNDYLLYGLKYGEFRKDLNYVFKSIISGIIQKDIIKMRKNLNILLIIATNGMAGVPVSAWHLVVHNIIYRRVYEGVLLQ